MTIVKRPYRSPLRQAQAEATRLRILAAGLALFAERGYPGTSVVEIAREAGVSAETVYASIGSKRGIIDALLAQVDARDIPTLAREAATAHGGTPGDDLAALVELAAVFWVEHGTLVRVLRRGVGDPEIGDAWLARQAARRQVIRTMIERWPVGTIQADLDADRAADIAWMLTSDETFEQLVERRGWSVELYVSWIGATLRASILAPS